MKLLKTRRGNNRTPVKTKLADSINFKAKNARTLLEAGSYIKILWG